MGALVQALWEKGFRDYQEDFYGYGIFKHKWVFVVADGMGGHSHGDMASQITVKTIMQFWYKNSCSVENIIDCIYESIQHALIQMKKNIGEEQGGCTLTYAVWDPMNETLHYSWIGDSRIYLILPPDSELDCKIATYKIEKNGWRLCSLTADHSLIWQHYENGELTYDDLKNHPFKSRLSRSLSNNLNIEDIMDIPVRSIKVPEKKGYLLLCTDGVWEAIESSPELLKLFYTYKEPQRISRAIKEHVARHQSDVENGDNFTAIITNLKYLTAQNKKGYKIPVTKKKDDVSDTMDNAQNYDENNQNNHNDYPVFQKTETKKYKLFFVFFLLGFLLGIGIHIFYVKQKSTIKEIPKTKKNIKPINHEKTLAAYYHEGNPEEVSLDQLVEIIQNSKNTGNTGYIIFSNNDKFINPKMYKVATEIQKADKTIKAKGKSQQQAEPLSKKGKKQQQAKSPSNRGKKNPQKSPGNKQPKKQMNKKPKKQKKQKSNNQPLPLKETSEPEEFRPKKDKRILHEKF